MHLHVFEALCHVTHKITNLSSSETQCDLDLTAKKASDLSKWPMGVDFETQRSSSHIRQIYTYFIKLDLTSGPFQCCAWFLLYSHDVES